VYVREDVVDVHMCMWTCASECAGCMSVDACVVHYVLTTCHVHSHGTRCLRCPRPPGQRTLARTVTLRLDPLPLQVALRQMQMSRRHLDPVIQTTRIPVTARRRENHRAASLASACVYVHIHVVFRNGSLTICRTVFKVVACCARS
jgi:hypothetical protein